MAVVTWGIISTARIGLQKVIPALQASRANRVRAIASRSLADAQAAARECRIPTAYGSYEELLNDPEIDAVYIPLPNHLHLPWTQKALQAGKHVLCEKPIALSAAEAMEIRETAAQFPHLKVMEAFMYRFHPQWEQVMSVLQQGTIGEIRSIHTIFSFFTANPDNIRNQPAAGGGALLDVGCYAVSSARLLFAEEPVRVSAVMDIDPAFKVDRQTSALLEFPNGTATFTCSTQGGRVNQVAILGTEGSVKMDTAFIPPAKAFNLHISTGNTSRVLRIPAADQFVLQADRFAQAVLNNEPVPYSVDDAVLNMKVLDAVRSSSERQKIITIEQ